MEQVHKIIVMLYFERQNNTELLISTRVIGKFNNDWWYKFQTEFVGYGNYTPTLEYMQMFPMSDGTPFDSKHCWLMVLSRSLLIMTIISRYVIHVCMRRCW